MLPCPAPDQLIAFLGGELAEKRAVEIEAHMDECGECRAVLSNMARGGPPPSLGRYRIDTVLGSGGMGIVYRGFDPQLARPIAIKVVRRAGEDTAGRQRLVREAQALARLSHPNVCHVYDVGTQDEEVWVAMELIEGVQLRQWASEGRTQDEIVEALLGAAEGIAAAHAVGLVHRDIKPENVLVTRDGRPIVTDFGLARHEDAVNPNAPTIASDPQLTATGAIAGTPAYLAPEQLLGDPIDARVDQFAWAVMAWELLTGARPFPVVFAVRVEAVKAGLAKPKLLDQHVFDALTRAMAADPADRFPSMRELIEALSAAPITAKPAPIVPVRGRTAALAGLAVLAATGIAVFAWQRPREQPKATAAAPLAAPVAQPAPQPATEPAPALAQTQIAAQPAPAPAPAPAPQPAPAVAVELPRAKPARKTATPAPAPAPKKDEQQLTDNVPPAPVGVPQPTQPTRHARYCRSCQVATVDAFCRIPTDFANTGYPRNFDVVDWGTVSKVEVETGTFRDEELHETVITLRGQRKTYRFTAEFLDTYVDTRVGALLAICPEDQNDLYKLSGGPTDLTRAVITLSGAPKTLVAAKLSAKHIPDIRLAAASLSKSLDRLEANGRYLVYAKVYGVDGSRYRMDRYWMQVNKGVKNEDALEPNKSAWMVVEKPEIVEIEGKEQLLVHAAAILDDIFPQ